jgi:hypothetical protein
MEPLFIWTKLEDGMESAELWWMWQTLQPYTTVAGTLHTVTSTCIFTANGWYYVFNELILVNAYHNDIICFWSIAFWPHEACAVTMISESPLTFPPASQILDSSILKEFTYDNFKFDENGR